MPRKPIAWWADFATVFGGIAALLALGFGLYTYRGAANLQRSLSARDTYREQVELSIQNPALADGRVNLDHPDSLSRYRWFVGHAFHSAEGILIAEPHDPGWKETIKTMIKNHWRYVCGSGDFPVDHYGEPFLNLASEAVLDASKSCSDSLAAAARRAGQRD